MAGLGEALGPGEEPKPDTIIDLAGRLAVVTLDPEESGLPQTRIKTHSLWTHEAHFGSVCRSMPTIQELVGARVRELRKARGWTLEELAEKADKHYTYIGGLERGDRNVTVEVLHAVASALQVPIKSLFNLQPHPLEVKLNAASDDILSAIQKGFRAIIDTKGKLAEYFLNRELEELQKKGVISDLVWSTKTASRISLSSSTENRCGWNARTSAHPTRSAKTICSGRSCRKPGTPKTGRQRERTGRTNLKSCRCACSTAREHGRICTSRPITLLRREKSPELLGDHANRSPGRAIRPLEDSPCLRHC